MTKGTHEEFLLRKLFNDFDLDKSGKFYKILLKFKN